MNTPQQKTSTDSLLPVFIMIGLAYSAAGLIFGLVITILTALAMRMMGLSVLYGAGLMAIAGGVLLFIVGPQEPVLSNLALVKAGLTHLFGVMPGPLFKGKIVTLPLDTAFKDALWTGLYASPVYAALFLGVFGYRSYHERKMTEATGWRPDQADAHRFPQKKLAALANTPAATATGTLLGLDKRGKHVELSDADANLHTLAVGTTGSGKTTSIGNIIEACIQKEQPIIIVDGKGGLRFAERVKAFSEKNNRPFYLFSMVGESVKYNPLATGGYTSKKDRIIELREWSEDHYRKLAEGYMQAVFRILDKAGISTDLYQLAKYMDAPELYQLVRDLQDESLIADIERIEEAEKHIESLRFEVKNFIQSEIGGLFDTREGRVLTLERGVKEKAVMFFSLQPLAFPAYANTLGKLIINDIKALAASQLTAGSASPLFVVLDEFSIFAGDQVINLINQGREAGICALLATQSLSDLEQARGKPFVGQVLNSTNNYIIQRQNNPEDAEILAAVIGTQKSADYTIQIGEGGATGLGTVRRTHEYMIHPDELKRLGMGEAIIVNKQKFAVSSVMIRQSAL